MKLFCRKARKITAVVLTALLLLFASTAVAGARTLKVGAYISGSSVNSLSGFETTVGRDMDFYLYFANWDSMYGVQLAREIVAYGRTPVVTWEPHGRSLDGIIEGRYDVYISDYADGLKSIPGTVLLRPLHEMNGNWYSWGYGRENNSPEKIVLAWRHIVDVYRSRGATNVKFVWAPNHVGGAGWSADSIPSYYPGDEYVDYAAIDGYNWGASKSGAKWQTFDQIFGPAYEKITSITTRPILIAETASTEIGGDKPAWIRQTFSRANSSYPQVMGLLWFQANKETDWRVDSSPASLAAFKESLLALNDIEAPSAQIVLPGAGLAKVHRRDRWTTISVKAVDPSGIDRVTFSIDGKLRGTATRSYSWRWRTHRVRTGWHAIGVKVFDTAGNVRAITKLVYVSR